MKKFNRILYAVIADMIDDLLKDDPEMTDEEIMENMYLVFDETTQLVFDDLSNAQKIGEIVDGDFVIQGESFSKDEMIDMLVNGIDYETDDAKKDAKSLVRYLNKTLDNNFMIYSGLSDEEMGAIIIEHRNTIVANISIGEGKIFLLQGESSETDINLFKQIYPEIIRWTLGEDQQTSEPPPQQPTPIKKLNKINKDAAIQKAKNYMKKYYEK